MIVIMITRQIHMNTAIHKIILMPIIIRLISIPVFRLFVTHESCQQLTVIRIFISGNLGHQPAANTLHCDEKMGFEFQNVVRQDNQANAPVFGNKTSFSLFGIDRLPEKTDDCDAKPDDHCGEYKEFHDNISLSQLFTREA